MLCDDGSAFMGHRPSEHVPHALFRAHRSDQAAQPVLSLCTPTQGTPARSTDNRSADTELPLRCKAAQLVGEICSPDWPMSTHREET